MRCDFKFRDRNEFKIAEIAPQQYNKIIYEEKKSYIRTENIHLSRDAVTYLKKKQQQIT